MPAVSGKLVSGQRAAAHVIQAVAMVQGCDASALDRDGCTPLYCAAAWNRLDTVRTLARDLGCDPKVKSGEGRTPVHVAAEQVGEM